MAVINGHFKKGSSYAYDALQVKDKNTFYYIDESKLYLGDILLSEDEQATKLADKITLADEQNIFESTTVEGALVELAGMIAGDISVDVDDEAEGILKRYTFYKAGEKLVDIDIPKDLFSVEGTFVSEDGSGNEGAFIKIDIGTSANDKKSSIYIDLQYLLSGITADTIVYKAAIEAAPSNGIEAAEAVTVGDALNDIYKKIDNISPSDFTWEEFLLDPVGVLNVVAYTGNEDLFGKTVGDLQENVVVGEDGITGILKYVGDYSGFSSKPEETSGNYLVLHCEVPEVSGATITVTVTKPTTLDTDGIVVLRIADKDTQTVTVRATKTGYEPVVKTFTLTGLTVEASS